MHLAVSTLIAFFLAGAIGDPTPREVWEKAIDRRLRAHLAAYRAGVRAESNDLGDDADRLMPGRPIFKGRDAVLDSYRTGHMKDIFILERSDLRWFCSEMAFAEFISAKRMNDGSVVRGKGTILFFMEDGEAMIDILAWNSD